MKKYRLAVCKGPDCKRGGSDAVYAAVKSELQAQGLADRCEATRGGCYGLCHMGPNVVIREVGGRPQDPFSREDFQLMGWEGEHHYAAMNPTKVPKVLAEHVGQDSPPADLLAQGKDNRAPLQLEAPAPDKARQ